MKKKKTNSRGSVWRKWDLHVHTPDTKLNNQYKIDDNVDKNVDKWNLFCEKIENSDVSVFGITDYFSVENYFIFLEKFKNKYPCSEKVFFPNIEFRLEVGVNKANEEVNIHVIFANDVDEEKIDSFLNKLETNISNNESAVFCNQLSSKNDYEKAGIKYRDIKKVFGNAEDYLIFVAVNNQGLRADNESPRKMNITDEIDKICDGFIGGSQNREYCLKTNRYEKNDDGTQDFAKKCPVISGCDAHSFDDLNNKLGKNYQKNDKKNKTCDYSETTWIKADPTFEGLKQIIYEPEERVKIQKENPAFEHDKPYFENIKIQNELDVYCTSATDENKLKIKKNHLNLNKNLVTIIGGRGEGKSTLINYLGNTFSKVGKNGNFTTNENFIVEHHKINSPDIAESDKQTFFASKKEEWQLDFVFIGQGSLKKKTDKDLSGTLKKILSLEETHFSQKLSNEILNINQRIEEIEKWKEEKDEVGNLVNTKEFQKTIIKNNTTLLENLKNSKNKEKIEKYNHNLKAISIFKININRADIVIIKVDNFVQEISDFIGENKLFKKPDLATYKTEIKKIKDKYEKLVKEKTEEIRKTEKSIELEQGNLKSRLDKLTEMRLDDEITKEEYKTKKAEIIQRQNELLRFDKKDVRERFELLNKFVEVFSEFFDLFKISYKTLPREEKVGILNNLVPNFFWDGKNLVAKPSPLLEMIVNWDKKEQWYTRQDSNL